MALDYTLKEGEFLGIPMLEVSYGVNLEKLEENQVLLIQYGE